MTKDVLSLIGVCGSREEEEAAVDSDGEKHNWSGGGEGGKMSWTFLGLLSSS